MSRLAFVTTMAGFPWGGSEVLWSQSASRALKRGSQVFVVAFEWSRVNPALTRLQHEGAEIAYRPERRAPGVVTRVTRRIAPGIVQRLEGGWARRLIAFRPAAVCISQGSVWEILGDSEVLRVAGQLRCPVVHLCQLNNETVVLSDGGRETIRRVFARSSRTLFVAEANRAMAERQLAVRLVNAAIVRNPVNLASTGPVEWRAGDDTAVFASVASLNVRHKGQDLLLEALGTQEWRDRNWLCRLYGDGADREYLERLALFYGVAKRVQFMGQVDDIRAVWRECDLLVMPSRMEGTPLALVEAMICGRPAVVTDVGGMAEWVEEPGYGFLAEAPSSRSFGAALERAWRRRGEWVQIGEAARRRALALFDPDPAGTLLSILEADARRGASSADSADSD